MDDNPAVVPTTTEDEALVDAYIARNRDALNKSIAQSREELRDGLRISARVSFDRLAWAAQPDKAARRMLSGHHDARFPSGSDKHVGQAEQSCVKNGGTRGANL